MNTVSVPELAYLHDPAPPNNILSTYLLPREYSAISIRGRFHYNATPSFTYAFNAVKEVATARVLDTLSPKNLQFPEPSKFDKIFASCWIDSNQVMMGSKDNALILWNTAQNTFKTIPLPAHSEIPPDSCGIHDIDVNPSRSLVVTGGQSPVDMTVLELPSFKPVALLQGHLDWVFAAKFLEDNIIASASRDSTVCLWKAPLEIDENNVVPIMQPLITRKEHTKKVRALQYNRHKMQVNTLSADRTVKIWDRTNMDVISTLTLAGQEELVCMGMAENLDVLAIGSQQGTTIVDTRTSSAVMQIPSLNEEWGIRSVNCYQYIVSIGGGMGRLSFFDLRVRHHLSSNERPFLQAGAGWICQDEFFTSLNLDRISHALYTHSFDPTHTRLLVAGGPIILGMKGVYAAVW
jgi:WD repeat-containing protein 40A